MAKMEKQGMNLHTTTRIPIDNQYAGTVGKAVYAFAYYEWMIIWIIEKFQTGFVQKYSRSNPMTSGNVEKKLKEIIAFNCMPNDANLKYIHLEFKRLIIKRNALIHAHPCTDIDGKQILTYQTEVSRELPDMKWPLYEVESFIKEIDAAVINAAHLFE